MEFTNEKLSARFVVPDRITVRQQLQYFSEASARRENFMERLWNGARALMTEWECPVLPDKDIPLDSLDDPLVTEVIIWASLAVQKHINDLETVPKNS